MGLLFTAAEDNEDVVELLGGVPLLTPPFIPDEIVRGSNFKGVPCGVDVEIGARGGGAGS